MTEIKVRTNTFSEKFPSYQHSLSDCSLNKLYFDLDFTTELMASNLTVVIGDSSMIYFPCRYSTFGCFTMVLTTNRIQHETICEFRPVACPIKTGNCTWAGLVNQIKTHISTNHAIVPALNSTSIVFVARSISLPGPTSWLMIQHCFGQTFILLLEKQNPSVGQKYFFDVQLIGSRQEAEGFAYKMELKSISGNSRLIWEAPPRSIRDRIPSAYNDCFRMQANHASLFIENDDLMFDVTIARC